VQNILVAFMIKSKVIIAVVLIGIISLTAYLYFKKQPVESVPNRATLVLKLQNFKEKEVVMAKWI
jgi:fumarate reductase subunit C